MKHTHQFTAPRASAAEATAARQLEQFMADRPQVAFAEYGRFGNHNRARVIAVINGDEYEGFGVTLNWALADARVMASGGYPKGLPGEGGFTVRMVQS